jgi:hypothetical protein
MTQSQSRSPKRPIPQLKRNRAKPRDRVDGENPALQLLQSNLVALASGAIADLGKLAALLTGCWHQERDRQAGLSSRLAQDKG